MLAGLLDWPQATFAAKVDVAGSTVKVSRETDTGEEILEMSLPALVTADLRLNEPRYIALPGIIKARSKPLDRRSPSVAPTQKIRNVSFAAAPARSQGVKVQSVSELVEALKSKGVLA